jgi:hypothetical protein
VHDGDVRFRSEITVLEAATFARWPRPPGRGVVSRLVRWSGTRGHPADQPVRHPTGTAASTRSGAGPAAAGLNAHAGQLSNPRRQVLGKLRRARLISLRDNIVDMHPLTRRHFRSSLRNSFPDAWRVGNAALYEFWARAPTSRPRSRRWSPCSWRYGTAARRVSHRGAARRV